MFSFSCSLFLVGRPGGLRYGRKRNVLQVFHEILYWWELPEKLASDHAVSPPTYLLQLEDASCKGNAAARTGCMMPSWMIEFVTFMSTVFLMFGLGRRTVSVENKMNRSLLASYM